jgi:hypothetical protein
MLFYKWADGKLVASKATNMAGFIGAKSVEEAKYEMVMETHEDAMVTSSLYRKNTEDFLLIQDFTAEFSVYVRSDCFHGLLEAIKLLQPLHEFTDFVNSTYEDIDEDEDEEDDANSNVKGSKSD